MNKNSYLLDVKLNWVYNFIVSFDYLDRKTAKELEIKRMKEYLESMPQVLFCNKKCFND